MSSAITGGGGGSQQSVVTINSPGILSPTSPEYGGEASSLIPSPLPPFESIDWNAHPKGLEDLIESTDIKAYFAQPDIPGHVNKAIILITDAFGWKLPTFRLIADTIAKRTQALVLIPDLIEGGLYPTSPQLISPPKPPPPNQTYLSQFSTFLSTTLSYASTIPSVATFMTKFSDDSILQKIDTILLSLVQNFHIDPLKIGVQGYGWGGNISLRLGGRYPPSPSSPPSPTNPPRIACFSISDPTNISGVFLMRKIKVNSLWCLSRTEHSAFPLAFREATEKTLREKGKEVESGFAWFDGVPFGYASRGHWGDKDMVRAADESLGRACEFFNANLK
ncbi:hypothetical protein HDU97_008456 [Phlyctochytrium planicorne]|nr:hypothetical protein HDU97_008456 [Phlyctochytrium planicorne]